MGLFRQCRFGEGGKGCGMLFIATIFDVWWWHLALQEAASLARGHSRRSELLKAAQRLRPFAKVAPASVIFDTLHPG